jgi:hypothetical protein
MYSDRRIISLGVALAGMIGALCSNAAAQVPYTIQKIATTGASFSRFPGYRVGLNDSGLISFAADTGPGRMGVFVSTVGNPSQLDASDSEYQYFDTPLINNHGTVVYKGLRRDGTQAVLRYDAGNRSILADSQDPVSDSLDQCR